MKFSTGSKFAVIMKSPFTEKVVVTYELESEALEEAAKAEARVHEQGYTDVFYSAKRLGA